MQTKLDHSIKQTTLILGDLFEEGKNEGYAKAMRERLPRGKYAYCSSCKKDRFITDDDFCESCMKFGKIVFQT